MSRLAGKAAVVTGAGGGLGRAIANAFAAEGATVALLDVNADLVEAAARAVPEGRGVAYVVDVRDRLAVRAAIDAFAASQGGLDILVNNAVAFHYAPLTEMPEDIVDGMLDIGIKGVFWSLQAATPHLVKRGGGSVINLSSIAVSFSIRNAAVYTSIKGAIDALTRQQAVELGAFGIRVNALAPGSVRTPGASSVIDAQGWLDREERTPLKRLATPEEVAAAAVFLASDDARSIAGVTLKIDAGMTVAGP
jgi:NAD(P)-dependent dehydrogenase (short-subunit alcohol dehydrogenase family)